VAGRQPYLRTVKTNVGYGRGAGRVVLAAGSRETGHLGSAHDEAGPEALKAAAWQRIAAGQGAYEPHGIRVKPGGTGTVSLALLAGVAGSHRMSIWKSALA
jgi:hypothetical protein